MIIFEIQGFNYQYPETAKDFSLQKWVDYLKEIKPLQPEYLQEIYSAETVEEKIRLFDEMPVAVRVGEFHPFICNEVAFWSGVNYSLLRKCNISTVETIWSNIQMAMVVEPEEFIGFEVDDETYYLPEKFMTDSTIEDYAESCAYEEAMNKVEQGEFEALPYVLAVLARKKKEGKKEGFDDYSIDLRAKLFRKKTSLHTLMQSAFFLQKLNSRLLQNSQIFMMATMISKLKQVQKN
jgi:hypothetical protein